MRLNLSITRCLLNEQNVLICFKALFELLSRLWFWQRSLMHRKIYALGHIILRIQKYTRLLERVVVGTLPLILHLLHQLVSTDQLRDLLELLSVTQTLRRIVYWGEILGLLISHVHIRGVLLIIILVHGKIVIILLLRLFADLRLCSHISNGLHLWCNLSRLFLFSIDLL